MEDHSLLKTIGIVLVTAISLGVTLLAGIFAPEHFGDIASVAVILGLVGDIAIFKIK